MTHTPPRAAWSPPPSRASRGLSLAELIVAFLTLSIVFVAVLNVIPGAILMEKKTSNRFVAGNLAQSTLENARTMSYQLSGMADGTNQPQPTVTVNGTAFQIYENVSDVSVPSTDASLSTRQLFSVTVTVNWQEAQASNSVTQTTMVQALIFNATR